MEHRVVVITGASRGIGAATARLAAQRGYLVCVNYIRNRAAAEAVVAEIIATGGEATAVQADIANESEVEGLFIEANRRFGRLDALVNNAGIVDRAMRVEQMSGARVTRMFAVNAVGPILCAREAVRRMSTERGGRGGAIVNVSSGAARLGSANEYVDYAASKGAIDSFTIGLAKEVAREGIRVNSVRAGITLTELHVASGDTGRVERLAPSIPLQRAAAPEEIARTIVWLLSEDASYVTGALLDVTGGI